MGVRVELCEIGKEAVSTLTYAPFDRKGLPLCECRCCLTLEILHSVKSSLKKHNTTTFFVTYPYVNYSDAFLLALVIISVCKPI
jgi:hypothetical protein